MKKLSTYVKMKQNNEAMFKELMFSTISSLIVKQGQEIGLELESIYQSLKTINFNDGRIAVGFLDDKVVVCVYTKAVGYTNEMYEHPVDDDYTIILNRAKTMYDKFSQV